MPNAIPAVVRARDPGLTDEQVVARVCAGEVELFEVLMRRHNQRVYRAVRAVLRDEAEIEEVMQQSHVAAFQHLAEFAGRARYSTWLVRIALNEALGRRRRGRNLVSLDAAGDGPVAEAGGAYSTRPPTPEDRAASRELAVVLEAAVDELPEGYRVVLMLRDIEGLDTADTAAALELSEEVIKQRLHRARTMLRERLESRLGGAAIAAFEFGSWRCDRVVAGVLAAIMVPGGRGAGG